jgi:predicted DCC family thiol-disulfide oxidoreductase YuxK
MRAAAAAREGAGPWLTRLIKADRVATDARGWAANLAPFRVVFVAGVALPAALHALTWTTAFPFPWLALADVALLGLALLGVLTRWSLAGAAAISLVLAALPPGESPASPFPPAAAWLLALLAAGPSGHYLSLDAARAAVRRADRGQVDAPAPDWSGLVTLRYAWALLGLLHLGAGLGGVETATHLAWPPRTDAGLVLGSLAASAFGLLFLPLVFIRAARPALLVGALAIHAGQGLASGHSLNIGYGGLFLSHVCLVDWTAAARALGRRRGRAPILVFYDGGCGFCRRAIAILRSVDLFDGVEPVPGLSTDPRRRRHPEITDEMLAHDVWAVDGSRTRPGYAAYRVIAARVPVLWPLVPLMALPPVARVGERVYRQVADSRECLLPAASSPRPESPPPSPLWIHAVGILALAGLGWLG